MTTAQTQTDWNCKTVQIQCKMSICNNKYAITHIHVVLVKI